MTQTLLDKLKEITGTVEIQGKEYFEINEEDLQEFALIGESYLLYVISDIRTSLGKTEKLMLDELAPEITKRIAELEAKLEVATEALYEISEHGHAKYTGEVADTALEKIG